MESHFNTTPLSAGTTNRIDRWALLLLPVFVAVIVVLAFLDIRTVYGPAWSVLAINGLVFVGASLFSAIVAVQAYLRGASRVALTFGTGMMTLGLAGLVSGYEVYVGRENSASAAYNCLALVAGAMFLAGGFNAALVREEADRSKSRGVMLVAAYAACLVFVGAVAWLAAAGHMPVFITPVGTTLVRTAVLTATVAEFLFASMLFAMLERYSRFAFLRWYWLGLALVGAGMAAADLSVPGTPMSWVCRIALVLGQAYIIVGLVSLARQSQVASAGVALSNEFQRLEAALVESQQNYRTLFTSMREGFVLHEIVLNENGEPAEWRFLDVNPAYERLVGLKRGDVVGKLRSEVFAVENPALLDIYCSVALAGEPVHSEVYSSAAKRYFEIHAYPTRPKQFAVIFTDITERKHAEHALRELDTHKRDFYRKTILAATNGKLVILDLDEIQELQGDLVRMWRFNTMDEHTVARQQAVELFETCGLETEQVHGFVTCAGEMLSNALKHAGGGEASFRRTGAGIIFTVSDNGPGIDSLNLPNIALVTGYSTVGTGGLGYKLIIACADKTYLATGPQGTTVAIEIGVCSPDAGELLLSATN